MPLYRISTSSWSAGSFSLALIQCMSMHKYKKTRERKQFPGFRCRNYCSEVVEPVAPVVSEAGFLAPVVLVVPPVLPVEPVAELLAEVAVVPVVVVFSSFLLLQFTSARAPANRSVQIMLLQSVDFITIFFRLFISSKPMPPPDKITVARFWWFNGMAGFLHPVEKISPVPVIRAFTCLNTRA